MSACEVETRLVLGDSSATSGMCGAVASILIADATGAQQGCVCEAHAAELERFGGWISLGPC